MNLRIIDGNIKALDEASNHPSTREQRIRARLQALSRAVLFANRQRAEFLVLRGKIQDLLSVEEEDLKITGQILNKFAGEVVLLVGDIDNEARNRFTPYIDQQKIILMPNYSGKNLSVTDALQMIASMQIKLKD